jgi:hypothetical protein
VPANLSVGPRGRARRQVKHPGLALRDGREKPGRCRASATQVRSRSGSLRKLLDLYGTRFRGQSPSLNMTTRRGAFWGNDLPTPTQKRCPGWHCIPRGHSPIDDLPGTCQGPANAGVTARGRREIARPLAPQPTGTESALAPHVRYTSVRAILRGGTQTAWTGRRCCRRYVATFTRFVHCGGCRIRAGVGSAPNRATSGYFCTAHCNGHTGKVRPV